MKLVPSAAIILALAALASPVHAQSYGGRTWGQPYYGAYAQPSPLSEAEHETHARLGAAGGGYTYGGGPVIQRGYGYGHRHDHGHRGYGGHGYGGFGGYSYGRSGYGYGYGRGYGYDRPPQPGYRDEWGYSDDRPPSRWRAGETRASRDYAHRSCNCSDVYLYDR